MGKTLYFINSVTAPSKAPVTVQAAYDYLRPFYGTLVSENGVKRMQRELEAMQDQLLAKRPCLRVFNVCFHSNGANPHLPSFLNVGDCYAAFIPVADPVFPLDLTE